MVGAPAPPVLSRAGSSWRPAAASLAFAMLAAAVAVNTASVAAERRWRLYTRCFGGRAGLAHAAVIIPPWIAFLAASRSLPAGDLGLPGRLPTWIGSGLQVGGMLMSILGFRQLGPGALINLDQFRPTAQPVGAGIYRLLQDPIYTGYALATAGWALRARSRSGLLLAGLMYALLTGVLSPVEGYGRRPAF